ncbi:MAG: TIGR03936 family radical SAM-associated protein [Candidatus Caldatribacteriota bacterium]|nr:TIGR03936 family radical SAM-associated protein [Candidatus Caldatribacteriota bacterium]
MEQLVRIKYCKDGPIKYISHLNLAQVFTRTLRRANIPVVISGGFNPRFRISFGPPLPLGISSTSEYLDIRLKEEVKVEELTERLNLVLPQGLKILRAKTIPSSADSLVKIIDKASYVITLKIKEKLLNSAVKNQENELKELEREVENNNKRFLNLDEIIVEKQTKNGIKMVDIRPSILDISVKKFKKQILELGLDLKIGQQGNLNPRYVAKAWISHFANCFDILQICRDGLYMKGKEII